MGGEGESEGCGWEKRERVGRQEREVSGGMYIVVSVP